MHTVTKYTCTCISCTRLHANSSDTRTEYPLLKAFFNAPQTLSLYLTDENIVNATLASFSHMAPIWRLDSVFFGDWEHGDAGSYSSEVEVPVPEVSA